MKDVILVRGEVSKGVFQGCACLERFLGRVWGLCGFFGLVSRLWVQVSLGGVRD